MPPPTLRSTWDKEADRQYEIMHGQILEAADNVGRYMRVYRSQIRDLVAAYLINLHGVVLSPRTRDRQAEIVANLGRAHGHRDHPASPVGNPRLAARGQRDTRADTDMQIPADPAAAVAGQLPGSAATSTGD